MGQVVIQPVQTRRDRKQFMRFLWDLYRDDPHWIPPLRRNQEELLGFHPHPFHDQADMQNFLALRDGKPVGRISALVNHAHNKRYEEKRGFFGFFESVRDEEVAFKLFDAAREWLGEQGMDQMRGPVNPSLNYEIGLLTEGFDSPPTFMMTYNPDYYPGFFDNYGFEKCQDLYAFWGHKDMLTSLDDKLAFINEEAIRRFDVKLRRMDHRNFDQEVRTFLNIYNQSLAGTWGFVPLSDGEVDHMAKSLKHLIVPEMTCVAEVEGRPVASVFGMLDYNPRIKQINGRLFPFGFLRLLTNRRKLHLVRLISTNVLPEYQRWGLGLVVLTKLVPDALAYGAKEAEFSWVLESNHLSYKSLKRGGAKLTKSYRIYDRDVR